MRMFSMVISQFLLLFCTFLAYILTFLFLIVLKFFKLFNKLADRVLSGIKARVQRSGSFIKHYITMEIMIMILMTMMKIMMKIDDDED